MVRRQVWNLLGVLIVACVLTAGVGVLQPVGAAVDGEAIAAGNIKTLRTSTQVTGTIYLPMVSGRVVVTPSVTSALSAGGSHTCALTAAGGVKCWGSNISGALGDGTLTERLVPVDVIGLRSGVTAISAGGGHTCALTATGGVKCWGHNAYGQLGNGGGGESCSGSICHRSPVEVSGLESGVVAISAGSWHTCALTADGVVKCWGGNRIGQLGDGGGGLPCEVDTVCRFTPVDVVNLGSGVIAVNTMVDHTCAITAAGAVKCWGDNFAGQLGDGASGEEQYRPIPVQVTGLNSGVIALNVGLWHTCALTAAGGVKCWGGNRDGELGDGTQTDRLTPVDVIGLNGEVTALSAGYGHSCALTANHNVLCWGSNRYGQLGDGSYGYGNQSSIPVAVADLGGTGTAITTGAMHTCALTAGGGPKCWGTNFYGELGNGGGGLECGTLFSARCHPTPVDVVWP